MKSHTLMHARRVGASATNNPALLSSISLVTLQRPAENHFLAGTQCCLRLLNSSRSTCLRLERKKAATRSYGICSTRRAESIPLDSLPMSISSLLPNDFGVIQNGVQIVKAGDAGRGGDVVAFVAIELKQIWPRGTFNGLGHRLHLVSFA